MNIDVQQTPNPDTLKFVLDLELVQSGSIEFKAHSEAKEYPFVQKIFELGAELVFFGANFISVKKNSSLEWRQILEQIKNIIKNDFPKNFRAITVKKETTDNKDEMQVKKSIPLTNLVSASGSNKLPGNNLVDPRQFRQRSGRASCRRFACCL